MLVFATVNAPPSPESLKFPVFSQLAGNFASETGSLETPSSSGESTNFRFRLMGLVGALIEMLFTCSCP
jgi:hypothetical protein